MGNLNSWEKNYSGTSHHDDDDTGRRKRVARGVPQIMKGDENVTRQSAIKSPQIDGKGAPACEKPNAVKILPSFPWEAR